MNPGQLRPPSGNLTQASRCLGHQAGRCKNRQYEEISRTGMKGAQTAPDRLHKELSGESAGRRNCSSARGEAGSSPLFFPRKHLLFLVHVL